MRRLPRKDRSSSHPLLQRSRRRQSYPKACSQMWNTACGLQPAGHWPCQDRSFIFWRFAMIKTLIAVAVAGAFALPVVAAASAGGDNIVIAQSGGSGADGTMKQPGTGATAD